MHRPLNTPPEVMCAQAEDALARGLPLFVGLEANAGTAMVVGGGPSLADTLQTLRFHRERGGHIFSLNNTHDWLIEHGIFPQFHVMLDARQENAGFVRNPHEGVTYLIAAQCHPDVFNALAGQDVVVWLAEVEGMTEVAQRHKDKPITLVGGGSTVGLKAMALAYLWGYRRIRCFGFDSSYRGNRNHAFPQPLNDGEETIDVLHAGKRFRCARWMARQAEDFQHQAPDLASKGVAIHVHGDGLIPWINQQLETANVA